MTDEPEIYYREIDSQMGDGAHAISVCPYVVWRHTPKGVWIIPQWMYMRGYDDISLQRSAHFILHTSGKKFAYPTKEEARRSYIIRKHREIQHTAKQHDKAIKLLAIAKGEEHNPTEEYLKNHKPWELLFS